MIQTWSDPNEHAIFTYHSFSSCDWDKCKQCQNECNKTETRHFTIFSAYCLTTESYVFVVFISKENDIFVLCLQFFTSNQFLCDPRARGTRVLSVDHSRTKWKLFLERKRNKNCKLKTRKSPEKVIIWILFLPLFSDYFLIRLFQHNRKIYYEIVQS